MSIPSETERNKDLKITSADHIPSIKDELNAKMQVKAQRKRRFDKRNKLYRQKKFSRWMQKYFIEK